MKRIVLVLIMFPQLIFGQNIMHAMKADLQVGRLSYEEYLTNRVLAIYQPDQLPEPYRKISTSDVPMKSGTLIVAQARRNFHRLTSDQQRLLKPLLQRPELPFDIISPSGQFRIHYTVSGTEAVNPTDADPANGIPDFVDRVAEIFDYSHHVQTRVLGLQPPPSDQGRGSGDEYDIYIRNFNLIYGQTFYEDPVSGYPDRYISYLEIDNNYTGFPTSGLDGLRVTAAHEYSHAIQMGYKFKPDDDAFWENEVFYYEISATWMEDMVYDDVNDYYFYLNRFFRNINLPFDSYDGSHEYANCLFNIMLSQKYGDQIIRRIWEGIRDYPVLEAIDKSLRQSGSSFTEEFLNYAVWIYFTGSRSDTVDYFAEGPSYPEVTYEHIEIFDTDTTLSEKSAQFSFSYYQIIHSDNQHCITLIPINLETNTGIESKFRFDLSRRGGELFTTIEEGVKARMVVDNYTRWRATAIVMDQANTVSITDFVPIETNMIELNDLILGYGPNPYIPDQHGTFNVYFQLKEPGPVRVSIFTESGLKISEDLLPLRDSGVNTYIPQLSDKFSGGSGIYLLLLQAGDRSDLIKFAVVQQ